MSGGNGSVERRRALIELQVTYRALMRDWWWPGSEWNRDRLNAEYLLVESLVFILTGESRRGADRWRKRSAS
jgi:hypothetical protein